MQRNDDLYKSSCFTIESKTSDVESLDGFIQQASYKSSVGCLEFNKMLEVKVASCLNPTQTKKPKGVLGKARSCALRHCTPLH